MLIHFARTTQQFIFWFLLAVAISLTGIRLWFAEMNHYKGFVINFISERSGATVSMENLSARLSGLTPELLLTNVSINSADVTPKQSEHIALKIKEIHVSIAWLALLTAQNWIASAEVTIVGAEFSLQQRDGQWHVVGLTTNDTAQQPSWLLQGRHYQLLDSNISWITAAETLNTTVNLAIDNSAKQHHINALLKRSPTRFNTLLPAPRPDSLRLSAEITGDIFSGGADGTLFIEAKQLRLASWAILSEQLPKLPFNLIDGEMNGKAWMQLTQSKLTGLQGEVQLQQLQLTQQDKKLSIKQLQTRFTARQQAQHWQVSASDLLLRTHDKLSLNTTFKLSGENEELHHIALYIEHAAVEELNDVARFFIPPSKNHNGWLTQTVWQGSLEKVSAFISLADHHPTTQQFAINGTFNKLSIMPCAFLPIGIKHLSGHINGSEQSGTLWLNAENAQLNAPALYANELQLEHIKGALTWQQQTDAWLLASQQLAVKLQGLQSVSRLRLNVPKSSASPFLDLHTALSSDDIGKLHHNLPSKIMHPDNVTWLSRALVSGRITHGALLYYGKLDAFPFKDSSGVFEAQLQVAQGKLQYAPDWPAINDITAEVLFLQNKLHVNGWHGHSSGLSITQAIVINPELGNSKTLSIDGKVKGSIAQVLSFLKQTPLQARVSALSEAIVPHGDTEVAFSIALPLSKNKTVPKVNGTAQLRQAKLRIKALDLLVSHINGQLKFNQHGLYSNTLHAIAFAHPITAIIKDAGEQTQINVTGRASIKELQQQFPLPWWTIATGATDYQLRLNLPRNDDSATLQINSQLAGVALELPDGLAKSASQQQPLNLSFLLNGKDELPIHLDYARQLKAALIMTISSQNLRAGQVLIGEGELSAVGDTGFSLDIKRQNLSLNDWLNILLNARARGDEQSKLVNSITIQTERAYWYDTELGSFALSLQRQGEHWLGTIDNRAATGKFKIPFNCHDAQGIQLDMNRIDLALLKQLSYSKQQQDGGIALTRELMPETLPLFSLNSEHTLWRDLPLGRLSLTTERSAHGIKLQNLSLTGAEATVNLTGAWQQISAKQATTQLTGRIQSSNTGELLRKLGISNDLSEGNAALDFMLYWHNAPQHSRLTTMQGTATLQLKNGRLLSIEPGIGRILGILAVAQWGKRLQLDFSDLYAQGLSFNSIDGHFAIVNGIATSKNLIIDAIPAKITLTGLSNLANQTLDQHINVAPKGADAVPIAGTLLGKISSFFAQTLTGKDHDEFFFGSQYRALGTWKDIQIIPLHQNDGLMQKTWTTLNRFPWLGHRLKIKPQQ